MYSFLISSCFVFFIFLFALVVFAGEYWIRKFKEQIEQIEQAHNEINSLIDATSKKQIELEYRIFKLRNEIERKNNDVKD